MAFSRKIRKILKSVLFPVSTTTINNLGKTKAYFVNTLRVNNFPLCYKKSDSPESWSTIYFASLNKWKVTHAAAYSRKNGLTNALLHKQEITTLIIHRIKSECEYLLFPLLTRSVYPLLLQHKKIEGNY